MPKDVAFTVEYPVRSAQTAVNELLKLDREPPAVSEGKFDLKVLYRTFLALHDVRPQVIEPAL
jgi:oleate hydratase